MSHHSKRQANSKHGRTWITWQADSSEHGMEVATLVAGVTAANGGEPAWLLHTCAFASYSWRSAALAHACVCVCVCVKRVKRDVYEGVWR